jgi:hypothetical protein
MRAARPRQALNRHALQHAIADYIALDNPTAEFADEWK